MTMFLNVFPILNFTAGVLHGNASARGKPTNPKYTYSFLGTSALFAIGYASQIKPPVNPLIAITASIFATGGMFCMGHMTARIADDS
jgi:hypothetical protein